MPRNPAQKTLPATHPHRSGAILRWKNGDPKSSAGPWKYGLVAARSEIGGRLALEMLNLDDTGFDTWTLRTVHLGDACDVFEMPPTYRGLDGLVRATLDGFRDDKDIPWHDAFRDDDHPEQTAPLDTKTALQRLHVLDRLPDETIDDFARRSLRFSCAYASSAWNEASWNAQRLAVDGRRSSRAERFYEVILPIVIKQRSWASTLMVLAALSSRGHSRTPFAHTEGRPELRGAMLRRVYRFMLLSEQPHRSTYADLKRRDVERWPSTSSDDILPGLRDLRNEGYFNNQNHPLIDRTLFPQEWEPEIWDQLPLDDATYQVEHVLNDHWGQPYFPALLAYLVRARPEGESEEEAKARLKQAVEATLSRRLETAVPHAFLATLKTAVPCLTVSWP